MLIKTSSFLGLIKQSAFGFGGVQKTFNNILGKSVKPAGYTKPGLVNASGIRQGAHMPGAGLQQPKFGYNNSPQLQKIYMGQAYGV